MVSSDYFWNHFLKGFSILYPSQGPGPCKSFSYPHNKVHGLFLVLPLLSYRKPDSKLTHCVTPLWTGTIRWELPLDPATGLASGSCCCSFKKEGGRHPLRSPGQRSAAAAAKSLQSCPTLCDPRDDSPPGTSVPGILQARTLEWVAISFSNAWKWKVKGRSFSRVWLLATPWTAAYQAPLSMGFFRRKYWSGVPLPCRQSFKGVWGPCAYCWASPDTDLLCHFDKVLSPFWAQVLQL